MKEKTKDGRGRHPFSGRHSLGRQFSINARISRESYEIFMSWDAKSANLDDIIKLHANDYPRKEIAIKYPHRISFYISEDAYAHYSTFTDKTKDINDLILANRGLQVESTGLTSSRHHQINVRISDEAFEVYSSWLYKGDCMEKILTT